MNHHIGEIAAVLSDRVGLHVTAHLAGAKDPWQVVACANGNDVDDLCAQRLRAGFEIVRLIEAAYDIQTAKAWLFGTNARLNDQAPIEAIAHATQTEQFVDVRRAARAFIQHEP